MVSGVVVFIFGIIGVIASVYFIVNGWHNYQIATQEKKDAEMQSEYWRKMVPIERKYYLDHGCVPVGSFESPRSWSCPLDKYVPDFKPIPLRVSNGSVIQLQ
jgi:hypothetical protein